MNRKARTLGLILMCTIALACSKGYLTSSAKIVAVRPTQLNGLGSIRGRVLAKKGKHPLPGANVWIPNQASWGSAADRQGRFEIAKMPTGMYDLQAAYIGFKTHVLQGIIVKPDHTTMVEFYLSTDFSLSIIECPVVGTPKNQNTNP
ncbi:MAG: carboxypeptidase-like regulatory domain-containing protein [bacterium]